MKNTAAKAINSLVIFLVFISEILSTPSPYFKADFASQSAPEHGKGRATEAGAEQGTFPVRPSR
jgi:hypothetical protein